MTTERNQPPDDVVRAHLREATPLPAYTPAQWEELSARIIARAAPTLAARAPQPSWREDLAGLSRIVLPLAVAAGIAAVVILSRIEASASRESIPATAFLSAMAGETDRETVLDATLGSTGTGLMLAEGNSSP